MPSALEIVTVLLDLTGLGVTLWLGLMFLANNPARHMARIASGLMWCFSVVFALVLLQLARPILPQSPWLPYDLLRWLLIPIPLAWHGVVKAALPDPARGVGKRAGSLAVIATLLLFLMTAIIGPLAPLLGISPGWSWLFYPLFMVTAAACLVPSALLAWRARHANGNPSYRESARMLSIASALALVAAWYRIGAFWSNHDLGGLPALPGDVGLLAAIILLGAGVVLRQIGDGETNAPAFYYALANAIAMTLLYALIFGALALVAGISWVVLVAVVPLAVATHWLTDWLRTTFDRWFYRAPVQRLRYDLRQLLRALDYEESLSTQLSPLLERVAGQLGAPGAALFEPDQGSWRVLASFPVGVPALPDKLRDVQTITPLPLPPPDSVEAGPAWVLPVSGGVMFALWSRPTRSLNDVELQLLAEAAEQVAAVLDGWRAQHERLRAIEALASTYREEAEALRKTTFESMEPGPTASSEMRSWIEEALRNLHNVAYLGQHPMAALKSVTPHITVGEGQPVTLLDRGRAVRRLLENLIERLRPAGPLPAEPLPLEWRLFVVLSAAYLENVPNREIMSRLYIGEGTFHRARRQALDSLAAALAELERSAG